MTRDVATKLAPEAESAPLGSPRVGSRLSTARPEPRSGCGGSKGRAAFSISAKPQPDRPQIEWFLDSGIRLPSVGNRDVRHTQIVPSVTHFPGLHTREDGGKVGGPPGGA